MAKILIVDDSLVARMSVKSCIPKDQGHELIEAGDGNRAIELYKTVRPDVMFLDITMPVKNGLEVLEEVRGEFPQAVVIILSADIQKQTHEKAHNLGAFAIVKKPPVKETVQAELLRALSVAGAGGHHG
jgi:two-component system chemotaxis response regulator CheY